MIDRRERGGIPRELRSLLIYASAAANAWLRGLSIPVVALHYRYEPITALGLIRRCAHQYGVVNVGPWVPAHVLDYAVRLADNMSAASHAVSPQPPRFLKSPA